MGTSRARIHHIHTATNAIGTCTMTAHRFRTNKAGDVLLQFAAPAPPESVRNPTRHDTCLVRFCSIVDVRLLFANVCHLGVRHLDLS